MSTKQLLRLAAALGLALAVWGVMALVRRSDADRAHARFLSPVDTAMTDTVVVTKAGDDTVVLSRSGGRWRINGYPADAFSVSELLRGLADTAAAELVATSTASHGQLGVTADSARRTRISSRGSAVAELLAGKRATSPAGVYVRKAGSDEVYLLRGTLVGPLTRRADDWYERTFSTITLDSVGAVEIERGTARYRLRRGDTGWTLGSGARADSAAVANLLARYRILAAVGFASKAQADSLDWDEPQRRARLLDRKGRTLLSLRIDSIASGVWVRQDSGGPPYLIDSWTAARLTPAEATLRTRGGR